MTPDRRRVLLAAVVAGTSAPWPARAQQRRSLKDPLRLGVDPALADSGFARTLVGGFMADTGVAVLTAPQPASSLLETLERGELDAAIANAPTVEQRLFDQGLVHDRRPLARASFLIVGPAPRGRDRQDPAGIARGADAAAALAALHAAAQAAPDALRWVSADDGSGTHLVEQALWRAAKLAPAPRWTLAPAAGESLVAAARRAQAYALVERGAWLAQGGAPLAVLVDDEARTATPVHVMRAFRSSHPGAKLLADWIAGPRGARLVAGLRGYRLPDGAAR